jgi:hypothetical protein
MLQSIELATAPQVVLHFAGRERKAGSEVEFDRISVLITSEEQDQSFCTLSGCGDAPSAG